jgi:hypothetical protein
MASINVYIDKEKFEKFKEQAARDYDSVIPDDVGKGYLFSFESKTEVLDVNEIALSTTYGGSKQGVDVTITQNFTPDLTTKLTQVIITKFEKAKQLFESLR